MIIFHCFCCFWASLGLIPWAIAMQNRYCQTPLTFLRKYFLKSVDGIIFFKGLWINMLQKSPEPTDVGSGYLLPVSA